MKQEGENRMKKCKRIFTSLLVVLSLLTGILPAPGIASAGSGMGVPAPENLLADSSFDPTFSDGRDMFSGGGNGGSKGIVSINGNNAIQFRDSTTNGTETVGTGYFYEFKKGRKVVDRINEIYSLPEGSDPVYFYFEYKLERTAASNYLNAKDTKVSVEFTPNDGNVSNVPRPRFPTTENTITTTSAYTKDEPAGAEVMELISCQDIASYRFQIIPNGGTKTIDSLKLNFKVRVSDVRGTDEAYAVDDIALYEDPANPAGLQLDSANYTLQMGGTSTRSTVVTAVYRDGGTQDVTSVAKYFSSNTGVATVNSIGTIQAVAPGTATITTTFGGRITQAPVTVLPDPGTLPDLVVTDITWSPETPKEGELLVFTAVVKNQGSVDAVGGSGNIAFYVDGGATSVAAAAYNSTIPAGATVNVSAGSPWIALSVSSVKAVVDSASAITEKNEQNNEYTKSITVQQLPSNPDLVVTDIVWNPSSPNPGDAVLFTAKVKNQGTTATTGSFQVAFCVDGNSTPVSLGDFSGSIAPEQTVNVTAQTTWTAQPNHHKITATADTNNSITEKIECNNDFSKLIMLAAAELTKVNGATRAGVTATADSKSSDAIKAIDGSLDNRWDSATEPATLTIDLGQAYRINEVAISLGSGWTSGRKEKFTIRGSVDGSNFFELSPAAEYSFTGADYRKTISFNTAKVRWVQIYGEYNTDSLTRIQICEVDVYQDPEYMDDSTRKPDLVITGITTVPAGNLFEKDAVLLCAAVGNRGIGDFTGKLEVAFTVAGNTLYGSVENATLAENGSIAVSSSTPWTAVAGSSVVTAVADAANTVDETDEGNNAFSKSVSAQSAALKPPAPWSFHDIGAVGTPGMAVHSNGEFTVSGSGLDIGGISDQFAYLHQKVGQNHLLSARVVSQQNTNASAKGGLMFRETAATDSKYVAVLVTPTNGVKLQYRSATGGATTSRDLVASAATSLPQHLKLEKTGSTYTAYKSSDGVNWGAALGSCTVDMAAEIEAGLAACSRGNGVSAVKFDQVHVEEILLADIAVSDIDWYPANPLPGEEVTFRATVKNVGKVAAPTVSLPIRFTVVDREKSAEIGTATYTGSLAAGQEEVVEGTGKWNAVYGTGAVTAVISEGSGTTGDSSNNTLTEYIVVKQPGEGTSEFDQRADTFLNLVANRAIIPGDDKRKKLYYAMARFKQGIDIPYAIQLVTEANNEGADMFFHWANMECYNRYGHLYPQALKDKVKAKATSGVDYLALGTTENHYLMYHTAGYLAAQAWPDATFSWTRNGQNMTSSAQQLKNDCRVWLYNIMDEFVRKGVTEYDSTTYLTFYTNTMLSLYDHATEPEMKQRAKMTMESVFTSMAAEWVKGYYVSSTLRDYVVIQSPEEPAAATVLGWLYFGGVRMPTLFTVPSGQKDPEEFYSVLNACSSYRLLDIITRIGTDKSIPYVQKENNSWGNPKQTYINKVYGVASQYDGNGTLAWSDDTRRWMVRWVSPEKGSTFFITHPQFSEKYNGATKYEQVVQNKGQLLTVYNIPENDPRPYIEGPVSSSAFIKVIEEDGWVFCHGGDMLLAFKTMKPYVWGEDKTINAVAHKTIRSNYTKNGVYVDTALTEEFMAAGEDSLSSAERAANELARFAAAVKRGTTIDTSRLEDANPAISVTTRLGETVSITYCGDRVVNGVVQNYTSGWPTFDGPYMHQDYNGRYLLLQHGGEARQYDFSSWTVAAPVDSPDLVVADIIFTPEKPNSGEWVNMKAEVRNQGLKAIEAGRMKIAFYVDGSTEPISIVESSSVMDAGKTLLISADTPWKSMGGDHAVRVVIDTDNTVTESDTSNNESTKIFHVDAVPVIAHTPIKQFMKNRDTIIEAQIADELPVTASVYYRYGNSGAFVEAPMTKGAGGMYTAVIPGSDEDHVSYYIQAVNSKGRKAASLYVDDFQDTEYSYKHWKGIPANWDLYGTDSNGYITTKADSTRIFANIQDGSALKDYVIEMKAKFATRTATGYGEFYLRANDANDFYAAEVRVKDNQTVTLKLTYWKAGVYVKTLVQKDKAFDPTQWHTYKVGIKGNKLTFWVDGVEELSAADDENLLASGYPGMKSRLIGMQVDDFKVYTTADAVEGEPQYVVTVIADSAYEGGETPEGIKTMTVKEGVHGLRYFGVNVVSAVEHPGKETAVFVLQRNGVTVAVNAIQADFDGNIHKATAGFNVQPGDVVKAYIADILANAADAVSVQ